MNIPSLFLVDVISGEIEIFLQELDTNGLS